MFGRKRDKSHFVVEVEPHVEMEMKMKRYMKEQDELDQPE
jgi:hypothetical protein